GPGGNTTAVDPLEGIDVRRQDETSRGRVRGEAARLRPGIRQPGEVRRRCAGGGGRVVHGHHDLPGRRIVPGKRHVLELAGGQRRGGRPGAEQYPAGRRVAEVELDELAAAGLEAAAVADAGRDDGAGGGVRRVHRDVRDGQVRSRVRGHAVERELRADAV